MSKSRKIFKNDLLQLHFQYQKKSITIHGIQGILEPVANLYYNNNVLKKEDYINDRMIHCY